MEGLGPAVFCYVMPCVERLGNVHGWLLYLTLALILLTTLQIHVSSSALDSVVLMCQVLDTKFNWSPKYVITDEPYKSINLAIFTMEFGTWTSSGTSSLLSVSMRV